MKSTASICEIAGLAKVEVKDIQEVLDLYRQFSNPASRDRLFAAIANNRRAKTHGRLVGLGLLLSGAACVVFLCWAVRMLLFQ